MKWTKVPPTERGWYYRRGVSGKADLYFVDRHVHGFACIHAWDWYRVLRARPGDQIASMATYVLDLRVEWAGPIPEPEEADGE